MDNTLTASNNNGNRVVANTEQHNRARFRHPSELSPLLRIIDTTLVELLAKRQHTSRQVGEHKDIHGMDIIWKDREKLRINDVGEHAKRLGLDTDFARAMMLQVILHSCHVQLSQREEKLTAKKLELVKKSSPEWRAHLRDNLLKLCEYVAPKYETDLYGPGASAATRLYTEYEWKCINHEVENMKTGCYETALDLGCATGRLTRKLAKRFKRVIGIDISPHMLEIARNTPQEPSDGTIEYHEADIENGLLEIPNGSVNLVIMSVGTASDMYEIRKVLSSIRRVLTPNGKFVLSFYNKLALMYQLFMPWTLSLKAEVDIDKKYLEVTCGDQVFPIFAHWYDCGQVRSLLKKAKLECSGQFHTYPTIGSILPESVLAQPRDSASKGIEPLGHIKSIDKILSTQELGAYIIVTGHKPAVDNAS